MLDVGLPPWRVTPSRRVFSPSSLASLKTRPNSDDGCVRRSSSAVMSSELLHCRLPTHIGHLSSQPVVPPSWTRLLPLDRRCVARFDGPGQLVPTCLGLSLCAMTALGRLSARVARFSSAPISCLHSLTRRSIVGLYCPLFVVPYRPSPSCDGVQLSHAAERAHRDPSVSLDAVARAR